MKWCIKQINKIQKWNIKYRRSCKSKRGWRKRERQTETKPRDFGNEAVPEKDSTARDSAAPTRQKKATSSRWLNCYRQATDGIRSSSNSAVAQTSHSHQGKRSSARNGEFSDIHSARKCKQSHSATWTRKETKAKRCDRARGRQRLSDQNRCRSSWSASWTNTIPRIHTCPIV